MAVVVLWVSPKITGCFVGSCRLPTCILSPTRNREDLCCGGGCDAVSGPHACDLRMWGRQFPHLAG